MSKNKPSTIKRSTQHKIKAVGNAVAEKVLRAGSYGAIGGALAERIIAPETPLTAAIVLGSFAVVAAGFSLGRGDSKRWHREMTTWAKGREDNYAAMNARLQEARDQITPQQPAKRRWYQKGKVTPETAQVPPEIRKVGAPVVRSMVEGWDTAAAHAQDMQHLEATPPTPEVPEPRAEDTHERPAVAPAPAGHDPFPLTAILKR